MFLRAVLCVLFTIACANVDAFAAAKPLGLLTGEKTGTYVSIGRDIAIVGTEAGVPIEVKETEGSTENIKRLNSRENAALGIVQSDVLGFIARSSNKKLRGMSEKLRLILPLYKEEVHLLARGNIRNFGDLADKRVVVGEDGSGHMITAINLLGMMKTVPAEMIRKSPAEGIVMLLNGEADAMFFVGGKPVKLFSNLASLKKEDEPYRELLKEVHFVPLDHPRMLEEYEPAELAPKEYDFMPDAVPTVSVNAMLVTYDFSDRGTQQRTRCTQLRTLTEALKDNLRALQQSGHPKWKEVSFDHPQMNWKKDRCAWGESQVKEAKKPAPKKKEKQRPKYTGPKPPER